jgi:ribosomal protein L11 methyltransferase
MNWQKINWEKQWAAHAPHFSEGYVHLPLATPDAPPIRLKPGPGFGDLSHPTTRLMLKLLDAHAAVFRGQQVVDIGTGSGVLALAAIAAGAKHAIAIDIDPEALEHGRENARLNRVEDRISFCLPEELSNHCVNPAVIFMNMISSEQAVAVQSLPSLHHLAAEWFVSGIIIPEREDYMTQWRAPYWSFLEELEEEGWLALRWRSKPSIN